MDRLNRSALLAALLMFAGTTFAQVDERARELLEGWSPDQEIQEIRTMEQVMTMEIVEQDMSTSTRSIIDMDNERAIIISDTMGMEVIMRYANGTMTMETQGMSMPMPPGTEDAFEGVFDTTTYQGMLDDPDVSATYDGIVSYGGILSGHQVTISGAALPSANLGGEAAVDTVRIIFDDSGQPIGTSVAMDNFDLVSVYVGEPLLAGMVLFSSEIYQVEGEVATLFATMTYELVTINEPIDETLFE